MYSFKSLRAGFYSLILCLTAACGGGNQSSSSDVSSVSSPSTSSAPWSIFNIGNNKPIDLMDYITAIEHALKMKAEKEFLPLQPGDVPDTYANVDNLKQKFNYKPSTSVVDGVSNFVKWYMDYYLND